MILTNVKSKMLALTGGDLARLALLALIMGAAAISFSPIFVRLSQTGPTATAFWRLTLALPAFWLWMTFEPQPPAPARRRAKAVYGWLIAAGVCFAGDLAAFHWSIKLTAITNSIFLANLAPVFVTLGAWLLFKQRVTYIFIIGMVIALVGAGLLIGVSFTLSLGNLSGDGLGIATGMFYGGYFLCVKRLRSEFSTATIMFWSGVTAAMVLIPFTLASGENLGPISLWGWLILLGLAWLSHTSGQGLIAYALAHLPATFVSVTLLIQPVLSLFFAWLILKERVDFWQALGGMVVLTGIFIARRGSRLA
jgi:drug/metabolite transporter (DMT)-like permease